MPGGLGWGRGFAPHKHRAVRPRVEIVPKYRRPIFVGDDHHFSFEQFADLGDRHGESGETDLAVPLSGVDDDQIEFARVVLQQCERVAQNACASVSIERNLNQAPQFEFIVTNQQRVLLHYPLLLFDMISEQKNNSELRS